MGGRAGAVATVMAAVDLARVRLPGQAEGGGATQQDEQEELQACQQAGETLLEEQLVQLELPGPGPPQVSQVGLGSLDRWDSSLGPDPAGANRALSLTLQTERTEASPRVPHFTVSKVSVPKHEPSHEVRGRSRVPGPQSPPSIHLFNTPILTHMV